MATSGEPTSSEYCNLLKKRELHNKTLVAIKNFIESFEPKKSKTCRRVQIRLDELEKSHIKYEEVQALIDDIDKRPSVQNDIHMTLQEEYMDMRAALLDIIDEFERPIVSEQQTNSSNTSMANENNFLKLPSVPAPIFSGSLQDWPAFIDLFKAMFHDNPSIPVVQKFHYLKSCLQGSAADIVKTIPTTADNYGKAYEALVARYENKGLIIQSHIRSLFNTQKVQSASATSLRGLHQHIMSHVRALQALSQPVESWDAWLVTLLCSCMDNVTVSEWQLKQTSRDLPTFNEVESFLLNRVIAYEASEVSNSTTSIQANTELKPSCNLRLPSKKVLFAQPTSNKHKNYLLCAACGEPHSLYTCNKFSNMTVQERKQLVFNCRLCYNCLKSNHQSRQCKSKPCPLCGKKHHSKLHIDLQENNTVEVSDKIIQESSPDEALSLYVSTDQVMLATAIVYVHDRFGNPKECRAVLDSGSQANFVSKDCAKLLIRRFLN